LTDKLLPANPYVVGNPLTDSKGYGFYGREEIYDFLLQKLNARVRPPILLHGHRRIGKTSILRQMHRYMPADWKIIYFDFQGQSDDPLDAILYGIAYEICVVLGLDDLELEKINARTFRNQFLPKVYKALGGEKRRLVLLFDEFDVLDPAKSGDVFRYIRDWISSEQQVGYVFVVGRRPEHLSAIFRDLSTIVHVIGRLTRNEMTQLVRQPAGDYLEYPEKTIERIWQTTSGHPLATQLICFELWSRWVEKGRVPPEAVDSVLSDALRSGDNQLNQIYDGLDNAAHRLFLSAVGDTSDDRGRARLDKVLEILRAHLVNLGPSLSEIRSDLVKWDILIDGGNYFAFSVDLVRRWVILNRSLTRVMHEAQLISEQAYGFYKTAEFLRLSFLDKSDEERAVNLRDAISNYRHALGINPLLVAARAGLALALSEVGELDNALVAAEQAFEVDPGQKSLLLDVLMRLGEKQEAEKDFEAALINYNRALDLANDPDVTRRRNYLLIRMGDALAKEDRFHQAMERFQQAGAQNQAKKARMALDRNWRNLSERIETWLKSGDYERGLEHLGVFQKLNPGDERAQRRLQELKQEAIQYWKEKADERRTEGKLEEAKRLFKKAGLEEQAHELHQEIIRRDLIWNIENLEREQKWVEALVEFNKLARVWKSEGVLADWKLRLRRGRLVELNAKFEQEIREGRLDEGEATVAVIEREFPDYDQFMVEWMETGSSSAQTIFKKKTLQMWQEEIEILKKPRLLEQAKSLALNGNYEGMLECLEQASQLELTVPLTSLGKRREWLLSLRKKLTALVAFLSGFFLLFYRSNQSDFVTFLTASDSFLNTLLVVVLLFGVIYLGVWILVGDLLMIVPYVIRHRAPLVVTLVEASRVPSRTGNKIYRLMTYSNTIAMTIVFLGLELVFLYFASHHGNPFDLLASRWTYWLLMLGAGLYGFFFGVSISISTDNLNESRGTYHYSGVNVFVNLFFQAIGLPLVYLSPLLTQRLWGNYIVLHTIFMVVAVTFYFLVGQDSIYKLKNDNDKSDKKVSMA
jgi:tetratricopeptide (TPR) repeat protein